MRPLFAMVVASLAACAPVPDCVEALPEPCAPEYDATFDNVHERTLKPSCALGGGSCHSSEGRKGGLTLDDADEAYRGLVDEGRLSAGDPTCSEVVVRVLSTDGSIQMPPGVPLRDGERCAIIEWIRSGAAR